MMNVVAAFKNEGGFGQAKDEARHGTEPCRGDAEAAEGVALSAVIAGGDQTHVRLKELGGGHDHVTEHMQIVRIAEPLALKRYVDNSGGAVVHAARLWPKVRVVPMDGYKEALFMETRVMVDQRLGAVPWCTSKSMIMILRGASGPLSNAAAVIATLLSRQYDPKCSLDAWCPGGLTRENPHGLSPCHTRIATTVHTEQA